MVQERNIFYQNVRLTVTIPGRMPNGDIGFHCFHNSCSDKTLRDVRLMFEPDAYDKQFVQERHYPNYKDPNYQVHKVEKIKEGDGQPVF